jgi:Zn-dependent protease
MLGWSINLCRIFGIQLSVHASFAVLIVYWAWRGYAEDEWRGAGMHLALGVSFFVCVILHELGHALTARRYGVNTPRILLLPIGGMAEMDGIPRQPRAEFLITIAGPAVNFALALLLLPVVWPVFTREDGEILAAVGGYWPMLLWANLVMGTFNLLPVFPMDGGRIFRAMLASRLPYLRATWWAVTVGKISSIALAFSAIYFAESWLLGALFVFIFFAADAEYRHTVRREKEAAYWAQWAKQAQVLDPNQAEPPVLSGWHGRN